MGFVRETIIVIGLLAVVVLWVDGAPQERKLTKPSVCKCARSWTSPEDGDPCAEEQNGCANCDGNETGSWCSVENPGCSTDEGDGWSYCDDEQMWNECRCASSWTSPEDGDRCAEEQNGCANCDGDEARSWCIVENPGCSTDEGDGWSYCANPTTVAPAAKNGHEYCENQDMIRNEAECTSSSCCHWNTWEEGDASFDGDGRCWSDIGTNICLDMNQ